MFDHDEKPHDYTGFAEWEAAQPTNFFTSDRNLQRTLEFYWGSTRYKEHAAELYHFGGVSATALDKAARISNERANLPVLTRFDAIGNRIEDVDYHPSYHEAGRYVYGSGVMSAYGEPGNNLLALSLTYLSALNGEAGHNCPLACTAGVIKSLQTVGLHPAQSQFLEHTLDRLLDPDYDANYIGAQYLTEIQGGSDVGANTTQATPLDPQLGTWVLNGEKWFCSNVTADLALVTARVPGQGDGTRGLGLFLVPRHVDGKLNGMFINRIKEKVGTASLATAEVVFEDAVAYQVGDTQRGIQNVMTHVINTSRVYNAICTSAYARRAYVVAWTYAEHRNAFGHPIIHFPLVQDVLTKMRSDVTALASGSLFIARQLDRLELGDADAAIEEALRVAINLNKYRSAVIAHEVINHGIELLGGNGAIETFSVLPRLLRDNVVCENWEGTHNVLMAQVQRDMRRYGLHKSFLALIRRMLEPLAVRELRVNGLQALDQISAELDAILELEELMASVYFRPMMDRLTDLFYVACMAVEAAWELALKQDKTKQRLAEFYLYRRVMNRPLSDWTEYPEQISRLCYDVRPWKVDHKDHWEGDDDPFWR